MQPQRKLGRYFFFAILLGTTFLFFKMIASFLLPIFLAAVFCTLFYPLYERIATGLGGRKGLAAFLSCILLLLLLLIPIYVVTNLVVKEAVTFYNTAHEKVKEIIAQGEAGPIGKFRQLPLVRRLDLDHFDWRSGLQDMAQTTGGVVAATVAKASSGTLKVVITLFMTLFTMFYFFRDGPQLVKRLKYLIPLDRRHEDAIILRFASVSRATIRGTLLIALIQGTMAGLTLWAFGVGSPILWGVVAVLLSIIPMVGAWTVLIPAGLIQMATGHVWQGIAIIVITAVVIGNVDNLIRPRLVGQEAGMHDLMVFFSTLGGIGVFGPMGFVVGPMIAALFLSLLDIYGREFQDDLDASRTFQAPLVVVPTEAVVRPNVVIVDENGKAASVVPQEADEASGVEKPYRPSGQEPQPG